MIYFGICFTYYILCDINVQWVKEKDKKILREYQSLHE